MNSYVYRNNMYMCLCRWVLCACHMEPVKGFLGRYLRRRLMETEMISRSRCAQLGKIVDWIPRMWQHLNHFLEEHSSSDVTIGNRERGMEGRRGYSLVLDQS